VGILGLGVRSTAARCPYNGGRLTVNLRGAERKLLVAAVGGFFAIFVDVLDDPFEDEQVGGALAG
jgi:hypothetical protein